MPYLPQGGWCPHPGPPESLQPAHRRGWGSLYAALDRGRINAHQALRGLRWPVIRSPGARTAGLRRRRRESVWARRDAESSPQRGYYYYYHPSRHSAGQPIVAGWAYRFIARIGFTRESWTAAPVDVGRLRPEENAKTWSPRGG